jgi:hypothetical protein
MGMDVIGLKPANSAGKYFRNTVFYWIPLWGYIAHVCSGIVTQRDIERGEFNTGHRISRTKATAIGKRLHSLLRTGKTQAYAKRLRRSSLSRSKAPALVAAQKIVKALGTTERPDFSVENVREFADFCIASGGFEIW